MSNSVEYISKRFAKLVGGNDEAMQYIYSKQPELTKTYLSVAAARGKNCMHARTCLRLIFGNEMRVNKDEFKRALRSWGYCS